MFITRPCGVVGSVQGTLAVRGWWAKVRNPAMAT